MPVIAGRTREQLRVAVGYNLGAVQLITAAANGSTTTFLTDDLFGGADDHNGKWWLGTDSPNDGTKARVTDSTVSSDQTTLTLHPAVSSTLLSDTAELWLMGFDPALIEEFINQAIIDATGRAYDPEESLALHAGANIDRFDIPSQFSMLNRVDYRSSFAYKLIDSADAVWTAGSNVTASVDSEDKRQGSNSVKLVLAAGVSAGDVIAYKAITSLDISGMTHVEFWIKCTRDLSAADLKLLLDDTAAAVSPLETLDVPALTADTWTFVRVALANPESDTAIISVGLEDDVDLGAETVWIDDVRAVNNDSVIWQTLPRHNWQVDKSTRDLVLINGGRTVVGYSLLKLVGGDKPALLTADADVCEIDDWYVVARATELAFLASASAPGQDMDAMMQKARLWAAFAEQAKGAFPMLANTREVV